MDVETLSRIQFAFTVTFHYIYPPLSIGLSLALIYMKWMYLRTKNMHWESLTKFWLRVFALTFALGVATGIPLQFSLGTNWARYSRFVGDIFGSLLAAEGVFAFLVEAGFLGVLLFGWNRVSDRMHFLATIFVSLAAHFSAVWIVLANSWMHTPAGYTLTTEHGMEVAKVADFWQVLFHPSSIEHITHVIVGCWMAGALLIVSVGAYYLLKKRHIEFAKSSIRIGACITLIASVLQIFSAHMLAEVIARENPTKMAAFEGVFSTEPYAPLYLFGWVNQEEKTVTGLGIPGLLSFLIHEDPSVPVTGLNEFDPSLWPKLQPVFQAYHLMIAMWGFITLAAIVGLYVLRKDRWQRNPLMLKYLIASVLFPQLGGLAGWYASCLGRQPWVVHKLLKTKDAFSANITWEENLITLVLFIFAYSMFLVLFLVLLDGKIKHGPDTSEEHITYRSPYEKENHKK
jgi:cytochrome d ubiquinol oxidase subunit I